MKHPEEVTPAKFPVHEVIYHDKEEGFAIAAGSYKTKSEGWIRCLGMRWDGYKDRRYGYPSLGGSEVWFTLPEKISFELFDFIKGMKSNTIKRAIKRVEKRWPGKG